MDFGYTKIYLVELMDTSCVQCGILFSLTPLCVEHGLMGCPPIETRLISHTKLSGQLQ